MKPELITTLAEKVARDLWQKGNVSTAQLRGFFGHVRAVERELEFSEFAAIVPSIQQLEPLAAYYVGRGSNPNEKNQRKLLKQFIDLNVQCAQKGKKEFKEGLVTHFQSVVAYHKFVSR
ncbi:MAG: type III-A CRISPR-associated protein Csm2 [bacterium]|nr:type III-A CRISPR-associated protein Csm2 [bacterium]